MCYKEYIWKINDSVFYTMFYFQNYNLPVDGVEEGVGGRVCVVEENDPERHLSMRSSRQACTSMMPGVTMNPFCGPAESSIEIGKSAGWWLKSASAHSALL